jgi:antitoxin MazE
MKTTVQKWGNSLAVRIPRNISKDTNVIEGSSLEIVVKDGNIILSPSKKEYSLKKLLADINEQNIHEEISTGDRIGGEIW